MRWNFESIQSCAQPGWIKLEILTHVHRGDFVGLEVVLVLWMATHAYEAGSWLVFGLCVATMPLFGAMSAAAYWLVAVS